MRKDNDLTSYCVIKIEYPSLLFKLVQNTRIREGPDTVCSRSHRRTERRRHIFEIQSSMVQRVPGPRSIRNTSEDSSAIFSTFLGMKSKTWTMKKKLKRNRSLSTHFSTGCHAASARAFFVKIIKEPVKGNARKLSKYCSIHDCFTGPSIVRTQLEKINLSLK